jgi:hypothetical protein
MSLENSVRNFARPRPLGQVIRHLIRRPAQKEDTVAAEISCFPPALRPISLKLQEPSALSPKAVDKSVDEVWQTTPKPHQTSARLILPKNKAHSFVH